eukprot:3205945-Amphidinium_carterae.2
MTLQAVLSSSRVPHMRGDEEPVDLPTLLPFSVGRGGQVRRRRPYYRITPCKGDRELVRLEVPITTYNIGVVTEGMDMRKELILLWFHSQASGYDSSYPYTLKICNVRPPTS